jgi:hypothetical protein
VVAVSDRNTATRSAKTLLASTAFFASLGVFIVGIYTLTPFGCLLIFLEESFRSFFLKRNIYQKLSSKKIEHTFKAYQPSSVINLYFRNFWRR